MKHARLPAATRLIALHSFAWAKNTSPPDARAGDLQAPGGMPGSRHPVAANAGNDPVAPPAFHALALHRFANPR